MCPIRNAKGSTSGWRKMIPVGNNSSGKKDIGNGKDWGEYRI